MIHSTLQPAVIKCHMQITYMWRQRYYVLNTIQNSLPSNSGYPASNHTIRTTLPAPARNMKGMLMKFNSKVVPLSDEGITDVDIYCDCLRTLHSQAVVEAKTNFVPNRVHGASPPDISPLESLLPQSVHTTLAQLRSGHCRLLNSYKAHITSGISDVCPECVVAPHSVEHLFNCQFQFSSFHPTQLTV